MGPRSVSAQYRGLARAYIMRARSAHYIHNAMIQSFASLIERRHAKHPDRGIPASLMGIIGRRWEGDSDEFRLVFMNKVRNIKGIICEGRIGYHGLVHPGWEETEPNLIIAFVALTVSRAEAQFTTRVEHAFSLHSLARFYERSGKFQDADVKLAMASALAFNPAECSLGDDVPIGNWRGVIKQRTTNQGVIQMWCARTWIE